MNTQGEGQTPSGPLLKVDTARNGGTSQISQPGGIDERKKIGGRAGIVCCYLLVMYTIGGGLLMICIWLITGIILFIPCRKASKRCFLMARVSITPLRYEMIPSKECKTCGNGLCGAILWAILVGWHMMLFHWILAFLMLPFYCCNIPASHSHFMLGRVSIRPFTANIRKKEEWEMFYAN